MFLDGKTNRCRIYEMRPVQCHAQACWDPDRALDLLERPHLTRERVFGEFPPLLQLMTHYDKRCSFNSLKRAFEENEDSEDGAKAVIALMAYDESFREKMVAQVNIPSDTLDLCFGRSFAELVRLFGCRVVTGADGKRRLERLSKASG